MIFEIHDGNSGDYVIVWGETIEEIREKTDKETSKRGWSDCWSAPIKEEK